MKVVDYAGRGIGAASGGVITLLWLYGIWLPSTGISLTGINFVVSLLMALLALFAVIASVRGHFVVLLIVFAASFFPVGIALFGAEHWLAWAGRLNLCYLVAGILIWIGRRREAPVDVRGET